MTVEERSGVGLAAGLLSPADVERAARARLDAATWDFIAGGAGDERTLIANRTAYDRHPLVPRVLTGVTEPDLSVPVLGRTWPAPLAIAPTAYHTLVHPEGEVATARGAARVGVPFVVSTFAGRTVEDVAAAAGGPCWLQVYCFRDRAVTRALVERAAAAGFEAIVLTVDAPRLGRRLRDVRNGFVLPAGVAPANLPGGSYRSPAGHALTAFDPALDWSVLAWLRSVSPLPLVVKGVLAADDARRAVAAGADAIIVSNHGGRQLDGAPATLDVLPAVAAAVGGACPVLVDGGIRRGSDILTALTSGADAAMVGRPILYALAAGGAEGVSHVLDQMLTELRDAAVLSGTPLPVRTVAPVPRRDVHPSLDDPVLDTMNFLNEVTTRYPDAVSFAPGRPYDGFFDVEQIFAGIRTYVDHLGAGGLSGAQIRDALFQYGPTAGRIREIIAASLRADEGIDVAAESIVVTVGAQEAMVLAIRALITGPDDVLLVSSPCYVGIVGAARLFGIRVRAVPERPDGLRCADLVAACEEERARGRRPRAFYVIPDHANPSGNTVPEPVRRELLDVATRLDLVVLEDSPYRLVSPGAQVPSLKALDEHRRVLHLGSFSKTVFPGARVGFAVADQLVSDGAGGTRLLAEELVKIKSMITVNTSSLSQAAVAGMLLAAGGSAAALNEDTADYYGTAMRITLRELDRAFPRPERARLGVRWNEPTGGFFLSVEVPFVADNAALTRSAEEHGVIWTPMSYFYPEGGGECGIRLSVSYLSEEAIVEGVSRFARFVVEEAAREGGGAAVLSGCGGLGK
ncbi:aminotransferase class I/II-fold pyridoxal phosphate-dependent enzyme [Micromonospora robiginosa]|uniref:Aminotransferase class I/II-fold pyridoxal phosphate-dependent enzyme n=1 Tax=Micromonospora robiginosa TaxID=2749844 RepID=A0A7L6B3E2_9ACTN|nr:aminotransferase class I/II-fold pyridoxal phosphate-dependent enzyme [Micromonospora ferruginea]QLQ36508.1 aminotransferase class I/II-fold pyridoxal phosphate-dependent enzyme [Micromonospora ferruginea]